MNPWFPRGPPPRGRRDSSTARRSRRLDLLVPTSGLPSAAGELQPIRVRLAAGGFAASITTPVLWLRDLGLDGRSIGAAWPKEPSCDGEPRFGTLNLVDETIITRNEVVALLFNVSDIAASLARIEGLLEEDDGEEDDER